MSRQVSNAVLANKIDNLIERFDRFESRQTKIEDERLDQATKIQALRTDLDGTKTTISERIDGLDKRVLGWDIINSVAGLVLGGFVLLFKKS